MKKQIYPYYFYDSVHLTKNMHWVPKPLIILIEYSEFCPIWFYTWKNQHKIWNRPILQREEHKRQFLMIFQEKMHLKYYEKGSRDISHYKRSLLYSFITILWKKQSRLCLGGSTVAQKSLKNYLVLRQTEKLFGILKTRVWKYIASCKHQKYFKIWE